MTEGCSERFDQKTIYCRRLGHDLSFAYCRREAQGLPCRKILDCWFTVLDIRGYLEEYYRPQELAHIFTPPRPKMSTLVDLIKQAQERML
jgi:hypothetical protein